MTIDKALKSSGRPTNMNTCRVSKLNNVLHCCSRIIVSQINHVLNKRMVKIIAKRANRTDGRNAFIIEKLISKMCDRLRSITCRVAAWLCGGQRWSPRPQSLSGDFLSPWRGRP